MLSVKQKKVLALNTPKSVINHLLITLFCGKLVILNLLLCA
ncbi:hypothetical protein BTHERMOSOX_400 [Bathymodiolus thermophilus thioautotrophic gill symbiont]|nr:hypothetical protein BTHERMOSOX_400 [Bathymodiolus thermophilus thioautotrophic gill symbiont]